MEIATFLGVDFHPFIKHNECFRDWMPTSVPDQPIDSLVNLNREEKSSERHLLPVRSMREVLLDIIWRNQDRSQTHLLRVSFLLQWHFLTDPC